MTVAASDIEKAFLFFLGRRPNLEVTHRFDTLTQVNRFIMRSPEFRASAKARKNDLTWPLRQVFISRAARVLYCPIGKNACTFLKSLMVRISDVPHAGYLMHDVHLLTDHVRTGMQLSDYPRDKVDEVIFSPNYFRFALLRDPCDRLLSAYIEKFVVNRNAPSNILHTRTVLAPVQKALGMATPDFDRGITFRDFVTWIISAPAEKLDPHWRPQALYLAGMNYDRLYGFDQIDALIADLETRSGKTLPRQPRNVTGSGTGTLHPGAADLLPAEIMALPRLSRASFLDDSLIADITGYFQEDYNALDATRSHAS